MATLTIDKDYADNTILTESQLDAAFDSVETFLNTTKINEDNIQDSGVTTAKIAAAAVTTAKIDNSAITTALINDLAVTTAKINDLGVTTAKIAAANVTRAKLESVGQQISSSSGSFDHTSSSYGAVTNLSVSITTSGRPVMVFLQPSAAASSFIYISRGGTSIVSGGVKFSRSGADYEWTLSQGDDGAGKALNYTPGSFMILDTPSAGTYTYTVYVKVTGDYIGVYNCKLVAYEL